MTHAVLLALAALVLAACCALPTADDAATDDAGPPSAPTGAPSEDGTPAAPDLGSLWDFGDPAASEGRFREAVTAAEAAGDEVRAVEALTQMARAQGLQRRFDDAARTLDLAEARLPADAPRGRVRLLLERGRLLNSGTGPEPSRPLFLEAWEVASEAGEEYLAVDAAHMLGIVFTGEEGVAWNLRAMEAAEAASDPRAKLWLGALYNNTGWTRHEQGRHAEARDLFVKCRDWNAEQDRERGTQIACWSIAKMDRFLGRLDEALAEQERLLAEYEEAGRTDGYVHEELAECLHALGREEEARPHFRRAHALLSQDDWLVAEEPERLARLARLGGAAPAGE